MNVALVIQNHLRRVCLNIPPHLCKQMYTVETSWLGYLSAYTETVVLNDDWPVLPSVQLCRGRGVNVLTCREHSSSLSRKRLYTHPPRKPHHNLSCTKPSCLSPCCLRPNTLVPLTSKKHCTQTSVRCTHSCYFGSDSANITLDPKFGFLSQMLHEDEKLSYSGRQDIRMLAQENARQGKMSNELYDELVTESKREFGDHRGQELLSHLRDGATFCPKRNAFILQQASSQNPKIEVVLLHRSSVGAEPTPKRNWIPRPWLPCIYNCQQEDREAYGCPMKAILRYKWDRGVHKGSHTMMTYCLASLVAGSCDMYYAIDQKSSHHFNEFSGHLLSHVSYEYFKECSLRLPSKSPFLGRGGAGRLRQLIDDEAPRVMKNFHGDASDSPALFYRLNCSYLRKLLKPDDFPSISVEQSVESITSRPDLFVSKKLLIVIGPTIPTGCASMELTSTLGGSALFEARVVMSFTSSSSDSINPSTYGATRFSRHGGGAGGYTNWWRQVRGESPMMTKVDTPSSEGDVYPVLPRDAFQYATLFVRVDKGMEDSYHLDFYRSIGSQCDVFCGCSDLNPLLLSPGAKRSSKRECVTNGCNKKEKYFCGKVGCSTRICAQCFAAYEKEGRPVILSPTRSVDDVEDERGLENISDDESDGSSEGGDWYPDSEDQVDVDDDDDTEGEFFDSDEYYSSSDLGGNDDDGGGGDDDDDDDMNDDEFDGFNNEEDDSVVSVDFRDSDDEGEGSDLEGCKDDSKPHWKRRKIRDGMLESAMKMGVDVDSSPTSVDSLLTNFVSDASMLMCIPVFVSYRCLTLVCVLHCPGCIF